MLLYALYSPVWRQALILAWPMMLSHIFSTAMRTTDMILMGAFGPAAVAAVGLGDVWDRLVLQIGLGLGAGSIALISQETGVDRRDGNRSADVVLTQVLIAGAVAGLPFVLLAWSIPGQLIGLLGPSPDVVALAAQYLQIVFSSAPFRIMSLISSRALQGTGDTRTPMAVGVAANAANIVLSIALVTGCGPFPELGVPGVGWGTALANFLSAGAFIVLFLLPSTYLSLRLPPGGWDLAVTRQLLAVGVPRMLQGGYQSIIAFPFNALVLLFGTEAAAAYHISMRIQQQVMAPMGRSYDTVTTILVGQNLGRRRHAESRKVGKGMLWLAAATVGFVGICLLLSAPLAVRIFTDDAPTIAHGVWFLRTLSVGAPIFALHSVLSGLLTGAGDTRTGFYGSVMSQTFFMLGLSYVASVGLGLGLVGIYAGLLADHISRTLWVARRFRSGIWIEEAEQMIDERRRGRSNE